MSEAPAYAVLSVQTRELLFIEMWIGQMLCEAFNWVIKHYRGDRELGEGFGFPSSHSQWMGYFATFLICHLTFATNSYPQAGVACPCGLVAWAIAVAYHGILFGMWYYTVVEILPAVWPTSLYGRARIAALGNPVSTWFRIRDGWAWLRWRAEWERSRLNDVGSSPRRNSAVI
ncbi:uncharacterized protein B0H18DRAFT_994557, partial [Fomitopsis serialis]|uniref:uncharacterized protein n=1 Tax=Fomitopsis serialis TaxID=139415 RepID=UPI002007B5D9